MAQLGALGFRPRPLPPPSPPQRNPGAAGIGCQWLLPALGSFLSLRTTPLVTPCPCVCASVCVLGSALLVCWPLPGPVQCPSPAVTPPTTQTSAPGLVRRACMGPSRMLMGPLRWLRLYKETASNLPLACCVFMIREYRGQQREPQPGPVGQTTPQWGYEMGGGKIRGSLES